MSIPNSKWPIWASLLTRAVMAAKLLLNCQNWLSFTYHFRMWRFAVCVNTQGNLFLAFLNLNALPKHSVQGKLAWVHLRNLLSWNNLYSQAMSSFLNLVKVNVVLLFMVSWNWIHIFVLLFAGPPSRPKKNWTDRGVETRKKRAKVRTVRTFSSGLCAIDLTTEPH